MEHWDPQMMLDLYIYNYLIRKEMHTSAEIFAREANFYPRAVAINPPEGFLSEWWSIFWSVYSARFPNNIEATEGSSSKASENLPQNSHPILRNWDVNYMGQNTGNLLHSDLSTMMLRPEWKLPVSDFSMMEGETIPNLIASRMCEEERLRLPVRGLDHGSELLNVGQLACVLASSSSLIQEKVYNNPQLSFTRDIGTTLRKSTVVEPTRRSPKAIQIQTELADTDSKMREQEQLGLPVTNLTFDSQILDVNRLARVLPSSSKCSHPQKNKKRQLSVTRDAEPNHVPKPIQPKREPANTDAIIREQERSRLSVMGMNSDSQLVGVNQLARLLSSSSNCSRPPPPKNVNKKSQHPVKQVDRCASSLGRSTAAEPTRRAPKAMQRKRETIDHIGSSTSSNSTSSDPSS